MTPPNDECKCKERCSECRSMYLEHDGTCNHKEGYSKVKNHDNVNLKDANFWIGKEGDIIGDANLGYDCHYYIYSTKYQSIKDVEKLLKLLE